MATKLKVPGHVGGLAEYWRDTLTEHLLAMKVDTVINCASQESAQQPGEGRYPNTFFGTKRATLLKYSKLSSVHVSHAIRLTNFAF